MESAKAQPKYVYVLMGAVLAVMFIVGAFFEEGIAFFDPVYTTQMSDVEYYLSLVVVLIAVGVFLFLAHHYYAIRLNWWFFSFAAVLFVSNMIAILIFPSIVQGFGEDSLGHVYPFVYFLADSKRVRFVLTFGIACVYLYLIYAIVPKVLRNSRQINIYFFGCIGVSLVAILWSYAFETKIYQYYFDSSFDLNTENVASSFFNNRNTYGMMLLLGICSCAYLQNQSRHWWHYLTMSFLLFNLLFVLSKTSIILSAVFITAFLIYRYVVTVKRHWLKDNIVLLFFLLSAGFATWYILSGAISKSGILSKIYTNVTDAITKNSFDTIETRIMTWQRVLGFLSIQPYSLFGYGDGNFMWFLGQYEGNNISQLGYTHDGFIAMFAYGGIIRFLIYVAMLSHFFVVAIKNLAHHHANTIVSLLIFLIFLGHGFMETTSFLGADSKTLILLITVFVPVFTDRYHDRHKEIGLAQGMACSLPKKRKVAYSLTDTEAARLALFVFSLPLIVFVGLYNSIGAFHDPLVLVNSVFVYIVVAFVGGSINAVAHSKGKIAVIIFAVSSIFLTFFFLLLPIWIKGYLAFFINLLLLCGFVAFLQFFSRHGREERIKAYFLKVFLPYFAICGGLIMIDLAISTILAPLSQYSIVCLVVFDVLAFLFIVAISPLSKRLIYPLDDWWMRLERRSLHLAIRWESHLDLKASRYQNKKMRKLH